MVAMYQLGTTPDCAAVQHTIMYGTQLEKTRVGAVAKMHTRLSIHHHARNHNNNRVLTIIDREGRIVVIILIILSYIKITLYRTPLNTLTMLQITTAFSKTWMTMHVINANHQKTKKTD